MDNDKFHEVRPSLEGSSSSPHPDLVRRMAEEVDRSKEEPSLERSSSFPSVDIMRRMAEEVDRSKEGPSLEGSSSLPGTGRKGKMVEEVDRSKERKLNKLQKALLRFKKEVVNKTKKLDNLQIEDELYIDHIEKIECIEQMLPRILAKEPSRERSKITRRIRKLGKHQISYDPLEHLNKIDVLIEELEKLDLKGGDLLKKFKSKLNGYFDEEKTGKIKLEMEKNYILDKEVDMDK